MSGLAELRRGLYHCSRWDQWDDVRRSLGENTEKTVRLNVAGCKLELASRAQVSSISVRHHITRHLMFSISPQCSSPPAIPPLSLSFALSPLRSGSQSGPTGPGE